ncbi:MAG: hypothetical protein ACYDG2_20755 [Ruminiclostridium sp.]
MLSTIGSIASQSRIIKYNDIVIDKTGIGASGNYGSIGVYNYNWTYGGDGPAFAITNITNDGVNLQFILSSWGCGKVSPDSGNTSWGDVNYGLYFTDGTYIGIIDYAGLTIANGQAQIIPTPLPLTRTIVLNGKIPYKIIHWLRVYASGHMDDHNSPIYEYVLTKK